MRDKITGKSASKIAQMSQLHSLNTALNGFWLHLIECKITRQQGHETFFVAFSFTAVING